MTQQEAFAVLRSGRNAYLTGPAGSGKTHLLREFIAELKSRKVPVAVTASTGIAATHLDGITIHSWAGIGIQGSLAMQDIKRIAEVPQFARRFRGAQVLIIDEISMLHHFRLDLISEVLRVARGGFAPFGGIQVVLCGDFFQLPPVSRGDEPRGKFAYEASVWSAADFKICYLEEQFRQSDAALTSILNDIRGRQVSAATRELLRSRYRKPIQNVRNPTRLFPHNADVDAINTRELAKLPGQAYTYHMTVRGKPSAAEILKRNCLAPEVLKLKLGARVIFVKNNFEAGYVNGTTGEIADFRQGYPVVRTKDGRMLLVHPLEWEMENGGVKVVAALRQVPLRLAWAITVHKSQGMSLDALETDLSGTFVPGMGYVALSRARSLDGLSLLGINDLALRIEDAVFEVDGGMKIASQKFREEFIKEGGLVKHAAAKLGRPADGGSYADIRKEFPNVGKGWGKEEEEKLIAGYKNGIPVKELSAAHGRKPGGIRSRLRKLELIE